MSLQTENEYFLHVNILLNEQKIIYMFKLDEVNIFSRRHIFFRAHFFLVQIVAQSSETNEKSIFHFLVSEIWSFKIPRMF